MRSWALRQLKESAGQYAASAAVVAIVSAFAVLLLETTEVFSAAVASAGLDAVDAVRMGLGTVTVVFLGIAVVVAVLVISNTFSMVYAGRVRDIALLRLIGATGKQVRRTSLIDGVAVGLTGAVLGIVAGVLISLAAIAGISASTGAELSFIFVPQLILVPLIGSLVATVAASYAGSREVSRVAPIEATRSSAEGQRLPERAARGRSITGVVLFMAGLGLLGLGTVVGIAAPVGLLIAFPGGVLSIAGVIIGSPVLIPPVVALVARLLPRSAANRLAAANLLHDPVRTARTVISVVIGVTLLTMFTVAGEMFIAATRDYLGQGDDVASVIDGLLQAVYALTSFSVIVAAIGLGSTLSMSVLQRRRQIGVLRALGLTTRQTRRMLLAESLLVTVVGVIVGLVLGTLYGFVGANSILGSQYFGPPLLPPVFLIVLVVGALAFGALASLAPGRRASGIAPAVALREA
ncbi:FtsX-like permease family protein [Amnibacterium flavum]|uniref:ABC transporter permease n=1 Tax=Amnibacterium flavum TaxID=2173173 RepID=A0A2V1HSE1_9MICO|nr:ABC transporter permease [Amnibacterium flavum]PVZ93959.1 ABC transporter permease [Amnibacterium flavum]